MKKSRSLICLSLLLSILAAACHAPEEPVSHPSMEAAFLKSNAQWLGTFQNFVNQNEGLMQSGHLLLDISSTGDTILMKNSFLNQKGESSGYTGYSTILFQEGILINLDLSGIDSNTGNSIVDHVFWGKVLEKHIFIHEAYKEIFPDGRTESRKTNMHYYLIDENSIIQVADIWLNDSLLVFASSNLIRQ